MKIANIVVNVVLAAAVVVLFVLQFSGEGKEEHAEHHGTATEQIATGDIRMAYFSMDSVMAEWDMYFGYQQELAQSQAELEADFANRTQNFYQSVQDAQYRIQKGLVTRSEAEQLQQQLGEEEQKLMNLQNQYTAELQEEGMVKNRQMADMIERYVAELSKEQGYHYVFSYSFGGNLIYGAETNNITGIVIEGLNEKYKPGTNLDE